jgi:ammonia channel protein AmtB
METGMKIGDKVQVLPPHGEAGVVGTITHIYRANRDYERRARVWFDPPTYPAAGAMVVPAKMLKVVE